MSTTRRCAVCIRVSGLTGARGQYMRTCDTMTADLLPLRDWLTAQGVTQIAMEKVVKKSVEIF
ncbi:MAG: hypothetical protein ABI604_08630 [Nitrospirota bacterium]